MSLINRPCALNMYGTVSFNCDHCRTTNLPSLSVLALTLEFMLSGTVRSRSHEPETTKAGTEPLQSEQ